MTATMTTTLYRFTELSPKAQEQAIDAMRYDEVEGDWNGWSDQVLEDWKESLATEGVTDASFEYGVGYVQSDGAGFLGRLDLARWMKSQKLGNRYRTLYNAAAELNDVESFVYAIITREGYRRDYGGATEVHIGSYGNLGDDGILRLDAQVHTVEALLKEWYDARCRKLYDDLRAEHTAVTSDDFIRETLTDHYDERLWFQASGEPIYFEAP